MKNYLLSILAAVAVLCTACGGGDDPTNVAVTGISLDKNMLALEIGESVIVNATVEPQNATNKEVEWSSSDTSVATIDANGVVTGVGAGTATITATAKDGSGVTGTAKVTVTVAIPPTSVTFNGKTGLTEENVFLTWHGKVVDLKATFEPKEASLKTLFWNLDGATYDCSPVWNYDITDDKATISVVIPKDEQYPQDIRTTISAKLSKNSMPLAKAIIVSRCCFKGYLSFSEGNISNEFDVLHFGPEFFHENEYFRWDATGNRQFKDGWYFVGFCPPIDKPLISSSELYYKDSYIPADEYTLTSTSKNIKITKMENVCYKVERTKWDAYEEFTLTYTCGEYVYNIPCRLIP